MIGELPSAITIAAYVALLLAILGLWVGPIAWATMTLAAVALGYLSGTLAGPAALWMVLLAGFCLAYTHLKTARQSLLVGAASILTAVGIVAISLLLATHVLPGFRNLLVAQSIVLSPGAAPYTLYLNLDKTLVGILILGIVHRSLMTNRRQWMEALSRGAPILVATIGILVVCSLALGYLRFDPKWHALFWIWAPANLLMTCLSEEAFFRGFIQRELQDRLRQYRHAQWLAITVSAIAFGVAHFSGGVTYVLLATLAGAGYALVYARTGRIEMAMLTHFALNATHFLLFTYPRSGG